jgi:hypothetical protein
MEGPVAINIARFSDLFGRKASVLAAADGILPAMDGSDPATWDPTLDGVSAAPENHTVLYEDDLIRVISVMVAPGATEKPHHHRSPSIFVIDRMVKLRDFNGVTSQEISLPIPKDVVFPITLKFAPQPLHYVQNLDTKPFHATRIEFKQGFPLDGGTQ